MKVILPLIVLAGMLAFSACTSKTNSDEVIGAESSISHFDGKEEIDGKILAIDTNSALIVANSLSYTHTNGSTEEASAFLTEKEEIIKIEEKFSDSKTGNFGKRLFYFEKGKRLATKEIYQDNLRSTPQFVERVSYYKNDKVFFTEERTAEFEEQLEMNLFSMVKTSDCPSKNAMQILNQEGPFATTFQGFGGNGTIEILIVGENKEEGFTSGITVQHNEGDIGKLKANQRAYVGIPLEVQFERVIDNQGFEFQILLAAKILK
ncbi:MAG: hypothetical protein V4638_00050 [Bacteroidota bacterium]